MTQLQKVAYFEAYLGKPAFDKIGSGSSDVIDKSIGLAALAPILLGGIAGYGKSTLTSPDEKTLELAEADITLAEKKEFLRSLQEQQRRELLKRSILSEAKKQRTLHV